MLDDSIAVDTRLLRMQSITLGCQSKFQWKQVSVMSEDGVGSGGIGRIASVDFGTVRIGIAITDRQQKIASPLDNYRRQNDVQDGHYFRQLAEQEQISLFVVGLPIHLSGEESQKSLEAREFGNWLQNQTSVPVVFFDEPWLIESKLSEPVLQFVPVCYSSPIVETLDHQYRGLTGRPPLFGKRRPGPSDMCVMGGVPYSEMLNEVRVRLWGGKGDSGSVLPLYVRYICSANCPCSSRGLWIADALETDRGDQDQRSYEVWPVGC